VLRSLAAVALQSLELHLRDPPHATAVGARHRSNRRGRKLPSIEFWNRIFRYFGTQNILDKIQNIPYILEPKI
jgi:hypothetical protein